MDRPAAGRRQRHPERGQRGLRLHLAGGRGPRAAAARAPARGPDHGRAGPALQRRRQPAGAAAGRRGRAAPAAAPGPALHPGRVAQRRRRAAVHRLRQRAAAGAARARRAAAGSGAARPQGRVRARGSRRAPVRLPQLRRPGGGAARQQQKLHLPLLPQHHRPDRRRGRRAAPRRAARLHQPADPAGQHRPLRGRGLAGGGVPAPQRHRARRRRRGIVRLGGIPVVPPRTRLRLPGGRQRRLEPGAPRHRRAHLQGWHAHRAIPGPRATG